jgi:CRISPR-associated protein Csm2
MAKYNYNWNTLESGYLDEEGNFKLELIEDEADKLGKLFANGGINRSQRYEKLSSSQLRKFYNEVKALDAQITEENFSESLPFILMLKAKANYAYRGGGRNKKIPESFKDFIIKNVEIVSKERNYQSFDNFTTFFETVVGYFYGHGGEGNR